MREWGLRTPMTSKRPGRKAHARLARDARPGLPAGTRRRRQRPGQTRAPRGAAGRRSRPPAPSTAAAPSSARASRAPRARRSERAPPAPRRRSGPWRRGSCRPGGSPGPPHNGGPSAFNRATSASAVDPAAVERHGPAPPEPDRRRAGRLRRPRGGVAREEPLGRHLPGIVGLASADRGSPEALVDRIARRFRRNDDAPPRRSKRVSSSRETPLSRIGARTSISGASTRSAASKRNWSLPAAVEPWTIAAAPARRAYAATASACTARSAATESGYTPPRRMLPKMSGRA